MPNRSNGSYRPWFITAAVALLALGLLLGSLKPFAASSATTLSPPTEEQQNITVLQTEVKDLQTQVKTLSASLAALQTAVANVPRPFPPKCGQFMTSANWKQHLKDTAMDNNVVCFGNL